MVTFMVTPILAPVMCRWSAKVGFDDAAITTRLLPEAKKRRNHSEIVASTLNSGPRGRRACRAVALAKAGSNPLAPTNFLIIHSVFDVASRLLGMLCRAALSTI